LIGINTEGYPHYNLSSIKSAVRLRGADAFTASALIGAQAMGLDVVLELHMLK
jgi:hypothetical protein